MAFFSALKKAALDLVFPMHCADCGVEGAILCAPCRTKLAMIAPSCFVCKKLVPAAGKIPAGRTCAPCRKKTKISVFLSPYAYDTAVVRDLIHTLKYQRVRSVAATLGELLAAYINYFKIAVPRNALLAPIPLHKTRERGRGFNQSFLIAQTLGEKLGVSMRKNALQKIKKTPPQMELSRQERLKNAIGTFAVSDRSAVANRTIILLDDVKTTGATLEEAARILRSAGAKKIWAITVAH